VTYRLAHEELVWLIEDAGFVARQRDCFYNRI
jgi:2-iminoacetate synthase ThiH